MIFNPLIRKENSPKTNELKFITNLLSKGFESPYIWYEKGKLLESLQLYNKALESYHNALLLDSTFYKAQYRLKRIQKKVFLESIFEEIQELISNYIYKELKKSYEQYMKNYYNQLTEYYQLYIKQMEGYLIERMAFLLCESMKIFPDNLKNNFNNLLEELEEKNFIQFSEQKERVWVFTCNEVEKNFHEVEKLFRIYCLNEVIFQCPPPPDPFQEEIKNLFENKITFYYVWTKV